MAACVEVSEPLPAFQWPSPQFVGGAWPDLGRPLRLGVMASGQGSNFEALVAACRRGPAGAEVVELVVYNPLCEARRRAERLGIPCRLLDHRHFRERQLLDQQVAASFQANEVDLVVMAGWMRTRRFAPSNLTSMW